LKFQKKGGDKKEVTKVKDTQTFRVTDKCLIIISNMNVKVLENTYEVIFESELLYGI
jgi:hypothetical protein